MSEHSPTPWQQSWAGFVDAKGAFIGPVKSSNGDFSDADAAFIVRAVNYHARMVALLKEAVVMAETSGFRWPFPDPVKALLAELEAESEA